LTAPVDARSVGVRYWRVRATESDDITVTMLVVGSDSGTSTTRSR